MSPTLTDADKRSIARVRGRHQHDATLRDIDHATAEWVTHCDRKNLLAIIDRLTTQPQADAGELDQLRDKLAKVEGSLKNVSAKVLQESSAIFAMWPEGITSIDKPKLEEMATRRDSGSAFFATVILQVLASIEAGHMKNVSPEQIVVRRKL